MTALCKNDLSSDLNSTFGFRFFANKARVSRRVVSHAQKIERIRDQRVVQTKWHDPREKTSTIPIHILQFPAFYLLSKTTLNSPLPSKLPTTIKTAHFFSKEDTLKSVMKFTPQFTRAIFIPPFPFWTWSLLMPQPFLDISLIFQIRSISCSSSSVKSNFFQRFTSPS